MPNHNKKVISTAIALALLVGCSNNQKQAVKPSENSYLNQVQVNELVPIEEPTQMYSSSFAPKSNQYYSQKTTGSDHSMAQMPFVEGRVHTSSYNHQPELAPAVTAVQRVDHTSLSMNQTQIDQAGYFIGNWPSKPSQRTVRAFTTEESDSYKDTISRWLVMEGYLSTIYVLSDEVNETLSEDVEKSATYYDTLPTALNQIGSDASMKGVDFKSSLPKDFKLYVSLNNATRTATIYSVNNALEIHHQGNPVDTKLVEPEQSYQLFKGESYEQALYRWIGDVGYHKYGKLVNKDVEKVLAQKVIHSDVVNEDFAKATTLLMLQAVEQARKSELNERDGFISDLGKDELEVHLFLNDIKHEAIITSSNQPVTMFTVSKGSLKDNFHRLANAYGWNKNIENLDAHFMAQDYEIDFSYPIISEKGNIQRALTELLDGFPNLRGAIVPSTRTAYVVKEN
ncbi:hypothetical protein [Vibrio sp. THAF190c]|uniref:hypothetical protein n=1 Tax=Vibrio sp. THAF190c TaxID=2587865 RepID=UPI0012693B18|nr:hypothetical protein [Vibrio sp. THAF190c]QFT13392.1 hypothetical protein FIV04_25915 [Vibrio sp. THAF190c]